MYRQNAVQKCYEVTKKRGYKAFAVQNGGWCASGPLAEINFDWYGQSCACGTDGKGGPSVNQVYELKGQYDE